jgi:hypothetical protein
MAGLNRPKPLPLGKKAGMVTLVLKKLQPPKPTEEEDNKGIRST